MEPFDVPTTMSDKLSATDTSAMESPSGALYNTREICGNSRWWRRISTCVWFGTFHLLRQWHAPNANRHTCLCDRQYRATHCAESDILCLHDNGIKHVTFTAAHSKLQGLKEQLPVPSPSSLPHQMPPSTWLTGPSR
eukprot:19368-Amphidinium_carterae.1